MKNNVTDGERLAASHRGAMSIFLGFAILAGVTLTAAVIAQEKFAQPSQPASKRTGAADDSAPSKTKSSQAGTLDELFAVLDKDHDRRISQSEATGPYAQRFLQWDATGDGIATREEIHEFRASVGIDDNGQRIAGDAANGTKAAKGRVNVAAAPAILKEPADWRFEALPVPPGFAPEIKLKGAEEARFAPGMYDTVSDSYFTYVLAIVADGTPELGAAELKDFLEKYFRGLSTAVGRRKGMMPDPAQMQAVVTPAIGGADAANRFTAEVTFFDSFTDGRKTTLHVEAQVFPQPASKKTCLLLLISPSPKGSAAWQTLHEIGKKAALNLQ